MRGRTGCAAIAALFTCAAAGMATAQPGYPAKAIRDAVPFLAGVPPDLAAKLNGEIVRILHSADMKERLAALGAEPSGNTPAEFTAFIKMGIPKYAKVIRASGAKAD